MVVQHRSREVRRGGWRGDGLGETHTLRCMCVSSHTKHTDLLPACSFLFLSPPLSPALPLPPPTCSPHTEEQARTAHCSFFVSLSSSNSCFSASLLPLWVLVKYMLLALLTLRMLVLQVVSPTVPSALCTHNLNFSLSETLIFHLSLCL